MTETFKQFITEKKEIFYHGSNADIKEFSFKHISADGNRQLEGPGIYFTTMLDDAQKYGKNVYEVEIDVTKSKLVPTKKSFSRSDIEDLMKGAPELEDVLTDWDEFPKKALMKAADAVYDSWGPNQYFDMVTQVWADFYRDENVAWLEEMVKKGFMGYRVARTGGDHLILYDLSKIKSIKKIEG